MATVQPPTPPDGLLTRSRRWTRGTVLSLYGELDLDTVDDLRAALDEALRLPGSVVVVDCAELTFCDSTGLNSLLRAQAGAATEGSRIELARPRPLVLHMLELTGATQAFTVRDTVPG
ncbi:STAS domain-containing protein [Kitasatospora sp. NPDC094028]